MKYNSLIGLTVAILLAPTAASCQSGKPAATPAPAPKAESIGGPKWSEAAGWDLFFAGVEDGEARVFQSADFQRYLILPSGTKDAVVLSLKTKDVIVVPRAQIVTAGEDATMTGALPAAAGQFTRAGSDITFSASGSAWKLAPEPPLVGEISKADLLNKKKDYVAAARAYRPKSTAVSLIKGVRQPIEITVFFGTWCSYCKHYLPGFMKTLDAAANPSITVKYVGISEDMSEPEALLTASAVTKTPTFIVASGGEEIGRIVEKPKATIEEDLAVLLMGGR
jgi:thiol-disulfide isomerase/thioredoxin